MSGFQLGEDFGPDGAQKHQPRLGDVPFKTGPRVDTKPLGNSLGGYLAQSGDLCGAAELSDDSFGVDLGKVHAALKHALSLETRMLYTSSVSSLT